MKELDSEGVGLGEFAVIATAAIVSLIFYNREHNLECSESICESIYSARPDL
jgi:hypothetical protein